MSQLTMSQTQINNMTPSKGIVLYIPHVHKNIPDHRVKAMMIKAYLGHIDRVDIVPVAGKPYNRAFIHFAPNRWNMRNSNAMRALSQMQDGESIQVYYDDKYYWNVVISKCKALTAEEVEEKKRVRIRVKRRENPARRKKVIDLEPTNFVSAMISLEKNGTISSAERQSFVNLLDGEHKLIAEAAYELFKDDNDEEEMLETLRMICIYNKELMQSSVTQLNASDPIGARVLSSTPSPKHGEEQC
jgi:hypothetical protein